MKRETVVTANESAAPAESADESATGTRPLASLASLAPLAPLASLAASVDPADTVHVAPVTTPRAARADTEDMPPRSADVRGDPGGLTGAMAAALTRALSDSPPGPSSRPDHEPGAACELRHPARPGDPRSGREPPLLADVQDAADALLQEPSPTGESQRERRQDPERANEPRNGAPVATASKATHDELLLGLGRRFRGVSLKLEFELGANITRQIFRRDFVYVSQQLHALEASRRVQGLDRKWLNGALGVIERHGEGVKTLLQLTSAEVVELIARSGHAATQVKFGPAARLQATIVSPCARAFVDLLQIADAALMQLDRAWLLGLIDPETKGQRAADCRRALQGFKEIVRQQRHVVGEQVRAVNALRQVKRADDAPTAEASRASGTRRSGSGSAASDGEAPRRHALADTSHAQRTRRPSHEAHASHDVRSGSPKTADETGTA
jgi:hypothetical protein